MRFTIRVNVPEIPPGHAAVPAGERSLETARPEQVSGVVVDRKDLVGRSGDRRERREDVHTRRDHARAQRDAVPHRTLERRLPLQLESRLAHGLGRDAHVVPDPRRVLRIAVGGRPFRSGCRVPDSRRCRSRRSWRPVRCDLVCRGIIARLTFLPPPGRRSCTSCRRTSPGRRARWRSSSRSSGSTT